MSDLIRWAKENPRKSKLQNNTYLERLDNGFLAVRLHATQVLIIDPKSNRYQLNTGGWFTVTTKARINYYLPAGWRVYTDKGIWYLNTPNGPVPYADNMIIFPDSGKVEGEGPDPKALIKLRKQAKQFAKCYMAAFWNGNVPAPSGGDCWLCGMVGENGRSKSPDHIISHMNEKYYVPSLLALAVKRFPISKAAEHCLAVAWNPDAASQGHTLRSTLKGLYGSVGDEQLRKALYRFICEELGTSS